MDEHVIRTYLRTPEVFVDGNGAILRDASGREYLDFLGGIAVSALGHAHPELTSALRDQVGKVLHTSNLLRHSYTEQVASLIAELSGLHSVFFSNSGAEAIECALKIARKHQRNQGHDERTGFVALENSFHGRTMGALSVTHTPAYRAPFEPLIEGVQFVPAEDQQALSDALASNPAGLLIEPIQGEAGIVEMGIEYLQAARKLCDQTETVLIHDEVQCGSGRTGTFLAGDHAGIKPDVATLAKPLACGLPMGATVVREELAETLVPGDHGSTFGGGPLACCAAQIFLTTLKNGLQAAVVERGNQLREGLQSLAGEFNIIAELRGRGLMQALRLHRDAPALQQLLYENGILTNCTAGDVVRFLPPYVVTADQIDQCLDVLGTCLNAVAATQETQ